MKRTQADFAARLNQETEARITQMERQDYVFPRRFSRRDWLVWGLVTAGSLVMLLLGTQL